MSKLRYKYFTVWKTKMERSLYFKEIFSKKDFIVGKVTVAYKELLNDINDSETIRIFELGFAFCSRHDNFSKVRGRLIASGRLSKKPITISFSNNTENFHERLIENIKDTTVFVGNKKISWMKGLTVKNLM